MLRAVLSVLLAVLSLGLLAPPAGLAAPTPVACTSDCLVYGSAAGFVSPVTTLGEGGRVTWTSLDGPHTATETSPDYYMAPCIDEPFTATASATVRFYIQSYYGEGALVSLRYVVVNGYPMGMMTVCSSAFGLPDGSFLLSYTSHAPGDGGAGGTLLVRA